MTTRMRAAVVGMVATMGVTLLAACGGDDDGMEASVVVVPSAEAAMVYVARDQGYFEDEGLELSIQTSANGPANVAAVVSNQAQFGNGADTAVLLARSKGLPIVAVAASAGTTRQMEDNNSQTLVMGDSSIERYRDLEGKTVGVVAVKNQLELFIRDLVDKDGGDSSKVKFIQLAFPDMVEALTSGRVDAVTELEPFVSALLAKDARSIGSYYGEVLGPETAYNYYFANESFAKENPDAVKAFNTAIAKAGEYAAEHPEATRKALTEYTGLSADQVAKVRLPVYTVPLDQAVFDKVATMMEKYSFGVQAKDSEGALLSPK